MWRSWKPYIHLVGMENGTVAMGNGNGSSTS